MTAPDDSYYAAVETHFVERRGSPLFVTPAEWHLVWRWEQEGVPLHVVKEGIDRVFERPKARLKPRRLAYCRQAVEASFRRFREASVGGRKRGDADDFDVASHVEELSRRLTAVAEAQSGASEGFASTLRAAVALLDSMARDASDSSMARIAEFESRLAEIESRLLAESEAAMGEVARSELRADAERMLSSYRERMPEKVYFAAVESAYHRRLRSRLQLPTLSLYDR